MDDMGTFRVDIELENPAYPGVRRMVSGALVDTGAELSWVPAPVLDALGIDRFSVWRFRQPAGAGNPILPGWYADPEAHVFEGQYWIYPTYSAPYDQQTFMDAFSSRDLITWEKHPRVLDVRDVKWARRALWAPSIVEKDGWYYLFFGAN